MVFNKYHNVVTFHSPTFQECCVSVWVNASENGQISQTQSAFLGKYDLVGSLDGYPKYYKYQWGIEAYLFYRKKGEKV